MSSRSTHLLLIIFFAFSFLFGGLFSRDGFGQASDRALLSSPANGDHPYRRDRLNWEQRGRSVPPGESASKVRARAYRQKMAMRTRRASMARTVLSTTHPPKQSLDGASASSNFWVPIGPAPLASDATGDGMQDYNWVSGRATSVLIDPADGSGNTVFLGGAYGGLW